MTSTSPEPPARRVVLQAPPEVAPHEGASGVLLNALPMLGSIGSILLLTTTGGGAGGRSYLAAGMFGLATLGFVVVQVDRQRRQRARAVTGSRTSYLHYLAGVRTEVRRAADRQRLALTRRHPDPDALPALAGERSLLWGRTPDDPDFLRVRYGRGTRPAALELVPPEAPMTDLTDPASLSALHRLLAVHRLQPDLPALLDLRTVGRVEVAGPAEERRSFARALVCAAVATHPPEALAVAVLAPDRHLAEWDWVKWLPHAASPRAHDSVGPRRLVATTPDELGSLLPEDRHVLLVGDGAELPPDGPVAAGALTVVDLGTGAETAAGHGLLRVDLGADRPVRADRCDPATAEALARRLAPLRSTAALRPGPATAAVPDAHELLGVDDVRRLDPAARWRDHSAGELLRVPIGVDDDGATVHLDLKESAQQGMGPHGLLIGATGSGKSELLRTLVLALATTHAPERLNLVLVDFKGGATFAGLATLPHVSAVITNLAQELTLVDRMHDALAGELVRRQELLRAAGGFASVRDYELARAAGAPLAPLPSLVVVVDEFSELLAEKPELLDLFVTIGRLGRSLGLHLLLAAQRLEEGRLRGLESHLSYRIGLRTFSAPESRAVLGVPDAHELPPVPGLGFLRSGPATLQRFTAGYVSGPPVPPVRRPADAPCAGILPFTLTEVRAPRPRGPEPLAAQPEPSGTFLDEAVARMTGHGPAAHRVWLPPLDAPDTLDRLLGDLKVDPRRGLGSATWRAAGRLVVPVGVVDRPREQRRDPLRLDLGGAAGHVGVVGGPRSGKSTLLRTVVTGLALTTTPLEAQFLVLDLGGGLAPLTGLPHVAGIATRAEPDVVRRVVAEARGVLDRREASFRTAGIDGIDTYRTRRAAGRADDGWGDVFLVVDGWSTLRADFEDLEREVQELAARGLAYGVHVVVAATRWADLRSSVRDLLGSRVELRLGDPIDSEVDRRAAALVPADRPGRGLVAGPAAVLTALPRVDGVAEAASLGDGTADLVARVRAAWPGPDGPRLRLLPERIGLERLREQAGPDDGRLLLGVDERELATVRLDPDADPHLLVLGEGRSGKSSLLRSYVHEVIRTRGPRQAQLVLVDYRRSLLGEVPDAHLLHHLASATQAAPALQDLASYLLGRLPGPDVTADQLRRRSWWTGAEVFVVVDDLDLVGTGHASPLQPLLPLLAQARDTGLHLVVARRCGGASRALHEPLLQSLRDLATPGLLLAGAPEEGVLLGGLRPGPAPPGRARLVTRDRGVEVVQLAWTEPAG